MSGEITGLRTLYPPDDLAFDIRNPNGQKSRWAEDEHKVENVLSSIVLSDEIPGGWKTAGGSLARNPQQGYPDLAPYSDIVAYIPGGRHVWEGTLDKRADVSGDQQSITPAAVGYQSMLEDNKAVRFGAINSDMSSLLNASVGREHAWLESKYQAPAPFSLVSDPTVDGSPQFKSTVQGKIYKPSYSVYFDAGPGLRIGAIWAYISPYGFGTHTADASVHATLAETDDSSFNGAGALVADASNPAYYASVVDNRRCVFFEAWYSAEAEAGSQGFEYGWTIQQWQIASAEAYGTIGFYGTQASGGFYCVPREILALFINKHTQLHANAAEMDDSGYQVKQAWYQTPQEPALIVKDITKYDYFDWFVYRGKQLDYKEPASYGKRWRSTVKDMALNETGVDSQRLWKDIVVQWTDPGNQQLLTAGPPGSGCDVTSTALEVTDPQHPAVAAKRERQYLLVINAPVTSTTAVELGVRFLEEASFVDHSGSATLTGFVMDDKMIFYPVSVVRSGDYINPTDSSNPGYRKIIQKTYTHTNRQCEIDLDAPATGMEALLERLNASLINTGA